MIDAALIERKIDIILENLRYLEQVQDVDAAVFHGSYEKLQAAKHSLQEAIEACIDIANHVIAAERFARAETYAGMFERLAEENIISSGLKDKLANMAKFRNLLVHRYGDIDEQRVWEMIQHDLADVESYVQEIERYILQKEKEDRM